MPYADPLTDAELETALAGLEDWSRDGNRIRRAVRVANGTGPGPRRRDDDR